MSGKVIESEIFDAPHNVAVGALEAISILDWYKADERQREVVDKVSRENPKNIFICGPSGSGKTLVGALALYIKYSKLVKQFGREEAKEKVQIVVCQYDNKGQQKLIQDLEWKYLPFLQFYDTRLEKFVKMENVEFLTLEELLGRKLDWNNPKVDMKEAATAALQNQAWTGKKILLLTDEVHPTGLTFTGDWREHSNEEERLDTVTIIRPHGLKPKEGEALFVPPENMETVELKAQYRNCLPILSFLHFWSTRTTLGNSMLFPGISSAPLSHLPPSQVPVWIRRTHATSDVEILKAVQDKLPGRGNDTSVTVVYHPRDEERRETKEFCSSNNWTYVSANDMFGCEDKTVVTIDCTNVESCSRARHRLFIITTHGDDPGADQVLSLAKKKRPLILEELTLRDLGVCLAVDPKKCPSGHSLQLQPTGDDWRCDGCGAGPYRGGGNGWLVRAYAHLFIPKRFNCPSCQFSRCQSCYDVDGYSCEAHSQILVIGQKYLNKPNVLKSILNDLFPICCYKTCLNLRDVLEFLLLAMDRHCHEKEIQISGSASFYYLVKSEEFQRDMDVTVKQKILVTLLNSMFNKENNFTEGEEIDLLSSLARQADRQQKLLMGNLGVMEKMLNIIRKKLHASICDGVMKTAWSTMWNLTDETPDNCERFLNGSGMDLFFKCKELFPEKADLLFNMIGLLGNVAEVPELRHNLMTNEFVEVLNSLLDYNSEVTHNAVDVLVQMTSDGPAAWTVAEPHREHVLQRMVRVVSRWNLKTNRRINYNSLEPIIRLLRVSDTSECQLWAVWTLANLTTVNAEKYCHLVEKEGGMELIEEMLNDNSDTVSRVRELAQVVRSNVLTD